MEKASDLKGKASISRKRIAEDFFESFESFDSNSFNSFNKYKDFI